MFDYNSFVENINLWKKKPLFWIAMVFLWPLFLLWILGLWSIRDIKANREIKPWYKTRGVYGLIVVAVILIGSFNSSLHNHQSTAQDTQSYSSSSSEDDDVSEDDDSSASSDSSEAQKSSIEAAEKASSEAAEKASSEAAEKASAEAAQSSIIAASSQSASIAEASSIAESQSRANSVAAQQATEQSQATPATAAADGNINNTEHDKWAIQDGYTWQTRKGHSTVIAPGQSLPAGYHWQVQ